VRVENERKRRSQVLHARHAHWSDSDEEEDERTAYIKPPESRKKRTVVLRPWTRQHQEQEQTGAWGVAPSGRLHSSNNEEEEEEGRKRQQHWGEEGNEAEAEAEEAEEDDVDNLAIRRARVRPRHVQHLADQSDSD
jgi:hypothetical protein